MAGGAAAWMKAENILCVRLDALGDLLMTGPALKALKTARPGRRITLLTSPGGAEAAALMPWLDGVIVHNAPWMKHGTAPRPEAELDLIERLRTERFEGSVIFTVYSQSPLPAAYLCLLSGISLRLAHCRENPYRLLTHWAAETEPGAGVRHEVRRQLDLAACAGADAADDRIPVAVSPAAFDRVDRLVRDRGISRPFVVMHPGASAPSRRYPAELFAAAAGMVAGESGLDVVFTGTYGEAAMVGRVRKAMGSRSHSFAGLLSLEELAALIARGAVLVSNNTGPVHLAAAVGTPVVDIYALTNPQHTPWKVASRVLFEDVPCRYCYRSVCPRGDNACISRIDPRTVAAAVRSLLRGGRVTAG